MLDVVGRLDRHAVAADEAGGAGERLDAAEQRGHPVAQPVDDAVLPALGRPEVDRDVADEPGPRR